MLRAPVYLPAATHGCIISCDRNTYGATAWTEDGLYAGYFLDRHLPDLPDWVYDVSGRRGANLWPGDDWEAGGSITDLPDGSVLWMPRGTGRIPVLRVRGWDNWFRDQGTIVLAITPASAPRGGTGLTGTYHAGSTFASPPVQTRLDPYLWFQSGDSSSRFRDWAPGPVPGIAPAAPFSTRWTGSLVAPRTEDFWLRVYNVRSYTSFITTQWWLDESAHVRVWLDGILVIDRSSTASSDGSFESNPLPLQAGQAYDLKVEYSFPGGPAPEFSLSWASSTIGWQRIPPAYLYPLPPEPRPVVQISTPDSSVGELGSDPATVRFSLASSLNKDLTVSFRVDGTARPEDHAPLPSTLVIPAGATFADLVVTPIDDSRLEGLETLRITLLPDPAYRGDETAGTMTLILQDDDNIVTSGLVAHYPLDETTGELLIPDRAGLRPAAFEGLVGGYRAPIPRWLPTTGKLDGALEFFEPETRILLPSSEITGDFTHSIWIRTTLPDLNLSGGPWSWYLSDGRSGLTVRGVSSFANTGPRVDDGQWHNLALVWDNTDKIMQHYLDGVLVGGGNHFNGAQLTAIQFGVSNQFPLGHPGQWFLGSIDDIRSYSRRLSPAELREFAEFQPGIATAPRFNPAAGTYLGTVSASLSTASTAAIIRYTLDGTEPTPTSPLYTDPLQLTQSVTLRARAYKPGLQPSLLGITAYEIFPGTTIFPTLLPAGSSTDGVSYELGLKFRTTTAGRLTALRYFKPAAETGTHTGRLWSATGTPLTNTSFVTETDSGWQTASLTPPFILAADTTYIVSVNCNTHYSSSNQALATEITNGPLVAIADGTNGLYGTINTFPTSSYQNTNYFRDVVFVPFTTYENWKISSGLVFDASATADPDSDGVPTLLEYALASSPTSASSVSLPTLQLSQLSPEISHLQLTFLRARDELTYTIEVSSDLVTWTVIATNPGALGESVTVTDPVSISESNHRRFFRLRVTLP